MITSLIRSGKIIHFDFKVASSYSKGYSSVGLKSK